METYSQNISSIPPRTTSEANYCSNDFIQRIKMFKELELLHVYHRLE